MKLIHFDTLPGNARMVPDYRNEIARSWEPGHVNAWGSESSGKSPGWMNSLYREVVSTATLFYVSPEACTLLTAAAEQVPLTGTLALDRDTYGAEESGLVFLATPPSMPIHGDLPEIRLHVLQWKFALHYTPEGTSAPAVGLMSYTYATPPDAQSPFFLYVTRAAWFVGERANAIPMGYAPDQDISDQAQLRSLFVAFMALRRSPGMLSENRQSPNRATAKRTLRAGHALDDVRVIDLTRRGGNGGEVDREYQHRWIVSGHWRQQACGPNLSQRRLTWIAPYIKGPDGAPLLTGEKVYKL